MEISGSSILLHVQDALASARFYEKLLDRKPVDSSPGFAMFVLPTGLGLGLWTRAGVSPPPNPTSGASDVGFKVKGAAAVDAAHADWKAKGAKIALAPEDQDFGRTFVALDPDGHRLRVYDIVEER